MKKNKSPKKIKLLNKNKLKKLVIFGLNFKDNNISDSSNIYIRNTLLLKNAGMEDIDDRKKAADIYTNNI